MRWYPIIIEPAQLNKQLDTVICHACAYIYNYELLSNFKFVRTDSKSYNFDICKRKSSDDTLIGI